MADDFHSYLNGLRRNLDPSSPLAEGVDRFPTLLESRARTLYDAATTRARLQDPNISSGESLRLKDSDPDRLGSVAHAELPTLFGPNAPGSPQVQYQQQLAAQQAQQAQQQGNESAAEADSYGQESRGLRLKRLGL